VVELMLAAVRSPASVSRTASVTSAPALASARAVSTPDTRGAAGHDRGLAGEIDSLDHLGVKSERGLNERVGGRVCHAPSLGHGIPLDKRPIDPGSGRATIERGCGRMVVTMPPENLIGEYLRARRELVRREDVDLPVIGNHRRRVPGLRREEVALLAGVSIDYYVRLEQARDQHPSAHVLDALARALQLDDDASAHLHRLASPRPRRRRKTPRPERVPGGILQLIETWSETPAYVYGRYMDVLAANPLATALASYYVVGENMVRAAFLDPRVRDMYGDWEWVTETTVAALRALVGPDVDDPQLNELVGELSVRSERFRQLWARHDARPKRSGTTNIDHPQVGPLELSYEKLPIPDTDRQTLVIYHAAPGSPTAQALALLATTTAGEREPIRTLATE
jgi:transcriptional regulator with XRE-family HTH domain